MYAAWQVGKQPLGTNVQLSHMADSLHTAGIPAYICICLICSHTPSLDCAALTAGPPLTSQTKSGPSPAFAVM